MFMVVDVGHKMTSVVKIGGGFQQFAEVRRQLVQWMQICEEHMCQVRHFACVRQSHSVPAAHLLDFFALIAAELSEFAPHTPRVQIGDDTIPDSGRR